MLNKFKVGDRVKYKNKNDDIYTIMKINGYFVHLDRGTTCGQACSFFELIERKIGDKWFKAKELNEDGTPIDPEAPVHKKINMTNEFEVGDRVKYGKLNYIGIYLISNLFKYTNNEFRANLNDEKGLAFTSIPLEFLELVERKIGGIWFKPEELYIHENALPPKYEFDKNKCGHTNYEGKEWNMEKKEELEFPEKPDCYEKAAQQEKECEEENSGGMISYNPNNGEIFYKSNKGNKIILREKFEDKEEEFKVDKFVFEMEIGENMREIGERIGGISLSYLETIRPCPINKNIKITLEISKNE